jgi:hypothetical protein
VALALCAVLAASVVAAVAWPAERTEVQVRPAAAGAAVAGRPAPPTGVVLPSLGVSSGLVELGLHPDGSLQVPTDAAVAGWFAGGARPGEPGPVVVVGHVDSRLGPGVFAGLSRLVAGDRVELALADGVVAAYEVTGLRQVAKDAFPSQEVYGAVAGDELRLITCGGEFDRQQRSYRDNIVVTAVRV